MKKLIAMCLALSMVIGWIVIPGTEVHAETLPYSGEVIDSVVEDLPSSVSEEIGVEYLTFELNDGQDGYIVTDCDESVTSVVVIPAIYNGLPVVEIGASAFEECTNITDIYIPEGVTKIGYSAFSRCTNLRWIGLPAGLENLEDQVFFECDSLSSIDIPWQVQSLGNYVFYSCDNLHTVNIGDNVTSIGDYAFSGCNNLYNVTIGQKVQTIGQHAFDGCGYLSSIAIPDSVTTIGDSAFEECNNLSTVQIGNGITSIGDNAFYSCDMLRELTIGNGELTIGNSAFYYCYSLQDLYIENAAYIGQNAFASCIDLRTVKLGSGTKHIGENAFWCCSVLQELSLGKSLEQVDNGAFSECFNLKQVYFEGTADEWGEIAIGDNNDALRTSTVTFGDGTSLAPEADWRRYLTFSMYEDGTWMVSRCDPSVVGNLTIPATYDGLPVTGILESAFADCPELTGLVIPYGITRIDRYAFNNCPKLKCIELPGSLTSIEDNVFSGCFALEELVIPASVTNIHEQAFWDGGPSVAFLVDDENPSYCADANGVLFSKDMTTLIAVPRGISGAYTIPAGVERIAGCAFYGCSNLTQVIFPDSVERIDAYAFVNCDFQQVLTIGSGVKVIGVNAFYSCKLMGITLPAGLEQIEYGAFWYSNLQTIRIPASVTYIGDDAFLQCGNLTGIWVDAQNNNYSSDSYGVLFDKNKTVLMATPGTITSYEIPNGVVRIGSNAFRYCQNLENVSIPDSVTTIGSYAFTYCEKLNAVVVPHGVTTIEDGAFAFNDELYSIRIPDSVTSIGMAAFWNSPVTIYCQIGSLVADYALNNEIPISYVDYLRDLRILTMPIKTVYPVDGRLDLTGLSLEATLEDGTTKIVTNGYLVETSSFSTPGEKQVSIELGDLVVIFTVLVDADMVALPESEHPYESNSDLTWYYQHPQPAEWLKITFSQDTETEENWDIICIEQEDGTRTDYSGTALAGQSVVVKGDSFHIHFTSDGSVTRYGFTVLSVEATDGDAPTDPTDPPTAPTDAPTDPTDAPTAPTDPDVPEADWEMYLSFELNGDGQSYCVSDCDTSIPGALTIPATYNGLPVTAIGNEAFYYCSGLRSVVIPASVTYLGDGAFKECYILESINIPDGIETIPGSIFDNCQSLNAITLPDSVTMIASYAFSDCYALTSIELPDSLETIADYAFSNAGLTTVRIPDNVTYIGEAAFCYCPLDGIWVSENNPMFTNDTYGVLFSEDMTWLYQAPCNLTGSYTIPSGVETIGCYAFAGAISVTEVIFPDSVKNIKTYAFSDTDLPEIVVGSGVESIGSYAFAYNGNLMSITIPATVNDIGDWILQNCPRATIYCYVGSMAAAYAGGMAIPVRYLDAVSTVSVATLPEKLVYPVGGRLKLDGLSLDVTLTDGRQMTLYTGFDVAECDFSTAGTKTITVSVNGVSVSFDVTVDADLVEYPESDHPYDNLCDITWNYTHKEAADQLKITFSDMTRTEQGWDFIIIRDSNGNETSYSGTELEGQTVTISGNSFTIRLTSDSSNAEYGFKIVSIEAVTLVDWESLLTFELNADGNGYIVTDCDESATGRLEIPDVYNGLRVRGIGDHAFENCVGLTEIVLPGEATTIGDYAFAYCSGLVEITIPVSVTKIGDYAFLACNALTKVYYGGNRKQWNAIEMGENNGPLPNAQIQFSSEGCDHIPGRTEVINEWGGNDCLENKYQEVQTYCADCGAAMGRQTITTPATGHKPGEIVIENEIAPSCYYGGQYQNVVYCTECNIEISRETVAIAPAGHTAGEPILSYERDASCQDEGIREYNVWCTECNDWMERIIEKTPSKGHTPGEEIVEPGASASCTNNGYQWKVVYCEECNTTISRTYEIIPAKGHTPGEMQVVDSSAPSCTEAGYLWKTQDCTECGMQLNGEYEVIPAKGHTPGETIRENERPANCVSDGQYWSATYCEDCCSGLERELVIVPATGHTPGMEERLNERYATCTNPGCYDKIVYCSNEYCGMQIKTEFVYVPATGHTPMDPVIENQNEYTYESVVYCADCGMELSRDTVVIGCAHTSTTIETETTPATCTEPGVIITTEICLDCGETVSGFADDIEPLGHTAGDAVIENETANSYESVVYCATCGTELSRETIITECTHSYTDDNDAVCNNCGFVRQMVDTFDFVNYRIMFADSDTTHKNQRVIIYKLGDQIVNDISDEKALKAIDPSAETVWQTASINKILLTDAGNYVLMLKYNAGTAVVSVPKLITVSADPKLIIDGNNKITALDPDETHINHRVVVYHIGEAEVEDIYNVEALKAIDSAPETVWHMSEINRLALTEGGTYVLHYQYNIGTSAAYTVAQSFTVYAIPTLVIDQNNMFKATDENAGNKNHRVVIYTMGEELPEDLDIFDDKAVAAASVSSKTVWGLSEINKIEITEAGNYVVQLVYNIENGSKRIIAQAAVLYERPVLSVTDENKLLTSYQNTAVITNPRATYYYFGENSIEGLDIYNATALKAAATKVSAAIWTQNTIHKTELKDRGNYVIHLDYNEKVGDAGSVKKTVAITATIYDPAKPTLTVGEDNKLVFASTNTDATNYRATVYNLGDQTVENIYDEAALKAIDSAPVTKWGAGEINKIQLTEGNNYVVLVKYNLGTQTRTVAFQFAG